MPLTITITDRAMSGTLTAHTAHPAGDGWEVSWLPGRILDRNAATTAMMLAETVAAAPQSWNPRQRLIANWAAELGVEPETAVTLASVPPDDTAG